MRVAAKAPRYRWLGERRGVRCRGFTLLEVLIAFIILAVASAAIYRGLSSGMVGLGAADARTAAVLHARSKLDEVGVTIPMVPGEVSGAFEDGTAWSVTIAPFLAGAETEEAAQELPMMAYHVSVTVEAKDGVPVTLTTYRLALVQ
jgi:prepilin-type N-terminal cleavage/methylation domain-containing protein